MDNVDYKKLWLDYMVQQVCEEGLVDIKFGFGPDKDPDVTDEEWEQETCKHLYLVLTGKYQTNTETKCVVEEDGTTVTWESKEIWETPTPRLRGQTVLYTYIDDSMDF